MTKIEIINKAVYKPVAEHYRRNGWRHLENAISYASAGYPLRFYNGSMIKALRNFKRANSLEIPQWLNENIKFLSQMIADQILNGK